MPSSLRAIFRSFCVPSRSVRTPVTLPSTPLTSSVEALVASSVFTSLPSISAIFCSTLGPDCLGFLARLLQVALGEAEPLGHYAQVALQPGVGRVGLCLMLLEVATWEAKSACTALTLVSNDC